MTRASGSGPKFVTRLSRSMPVEELHRVVERRPPRCGRSRRWRWCWGGSAWRSRAPRARTARCPRRWCASARSSLTAVGRRSSACRARKTSPIAPAPSRRSIRYSPIRRASRSELARAQPRALRDRGAHHRPRARQREQRQQRRRTRARGRAAAGTPGAASISEAIPRLRSVEPAPGAHDRHAAVVPIGGEAQTGVAGGGGGGHEGQRLIAARRRRAKSGGENRRPGSRSSTRSAVSSSSGPSTRRRADAAESGCSDHEPAAIEGVGLAGVPARAASSDALSGR